MKHRCARRFLAAACPVFFALACQTSSSPGGNEGTGGSARGGATGGGGTISLGGSGVGGGSASGESEPTGGTASTGGISSDGSSTTGGTGSGGSTGGASAAGGNVTGGVGPGGRAENATGGSATGGTNSTGGTDATGGASAAGGSKASGGSAAGGGAPSDGSAGGGGTTGESSGSGGSPGAGGSTHAGKWQIMPLGDSITGTTCYPKLLSQELIAKGHTNFTFVGTVPNNQGCGSAPDVETEGHGGYLVTYMTTDSPPQGGKGTLTELLKWAAEKPDVVLLEYGTNDCWTASIPLSDIINAYGFVVDKFRAQNPNVIVFVAQITPLNPSGCTTCESRVEGLNALIPDWAASKTTATSPVYVANIFSALDPKTYLPNSTWTQDGCHPLQPAAQLMADKWYDGTTAQGIP